jgi:hypothetical protein
MISSCEVVPSGADGCGGVSALNSCRLSAGQLDTHSSNIHPVIAAESKLPSSLRAWGTVTEAHPKRRIVQGGKLAIAMDSVRFADGEKAALRATKEVKGGGHTGAMTAGIVATGLIFLPAGSLFLFMHGKDVTFPKVSEVPTFANGNFSIDLSRFQHPAASPGSTTSARWNHRFYDRSFFRESRHCPR